jgi:hypothetical protein
MPDAAKEITKQLNAIASDADFAGSTYDLAFGWESSGVGLEAVEPILRFMEDHPDIDFGVPGALVHFVERFYRKGYDEALMESLLRKPTGHTTWMLNRMINGAKTQPERDRLCRLMKKITTHPKALDSTRQRAMEYLEPDRHS